MSIYRSRIKARRSPNQLGQRLPRRLLKRNQYDMPLVLLTSLQQALWIGQESAMNEGQPDVIRVQPDLADPGAHRTASLLIVVSKTFPLDDFRDPWGNRLDDIAQLQHAIAQTWWNVRQAAFDLLGRPHLGFARSQPPEHPDHAPIQHQHQRGDK